MWLANLASAVCGFLSISYVISAPMVVGGGVEQTQTNILVTMETHGRQLAGFLETIPFLEAMDFGFWPLNWTSRKNDSF